MKRHNLVAELKRAKGPGTTKNKPSYHVRAAKVRERSKCNFGALDRLQAEFILKDRFGTKDHGKDGYLCLDGTLMKLYDTYISIHGMQVKTEDLFYILDNTESFSEIFKLLDDYKLERPTHIHVKLAKKLPIIHVFENKEYAGAVNFVNDTFLLKNLTTGTVDILPLDKKEIDDTIYVRSQDNSSELFMHVAKWWYTPSDCTPVQLFVKSELMDRNVLKLIK